MGRLRVRAYRYRGFWCWQITLDGECIAEGANLRKKTAQIEIDLWMRLIQRRQDLERWYGASNATVHINRDPDPGWWTR